MFNKITMGKKYTLEFHFEFVSVTKYLSLKKHLNSQQNKMGCKENTRKHFAWEIKSICMKICPKCEI